MKTVAFVNMFSYSGQPFCTIVYSDGSVDNFTWNGGQGKWVFVSKQQVSLAA